MLKQNDLVSPEDRITIELRRAFLNLPTAEPWRILGKQAENVARHYKSGQSLCDGEARQGMTLSNINLKTPRI
jgi:hypothetical protein